MEANCFARVVLPAPEEPATTILTLLEPSSVILGSSEFYVPAPLKVSYLSTSLARGLHIRIVMAKQIRREIPGHLSMLWRCEPSYLILYRDDTRVYLCRYPLPYEGSGAMWQWDALGLASRGFSHDSAMHNAEWLRA